MRFLFTSVPGASHVLPLIPLAHAALAAGHEVLVVSSGPAVTTAVAAGLHAVAVDDGESARPYEEMGRRVTETAIATEWSDARLTDWFASVFAEVGALMADGLLDTARRWRPDAVVYTPPQVIGLVAARALGVPAVLHGLGTRRPTFGPALAHLAPVADKLGVEDLSEAHVEIDLSPASLETIHQDVPEHAAARHTLPMRYVPYTGGGALPPWLLAPRTRPRVAVTLGSIPALYGDGGALQEVLRGAAELDVEVVLTTGGAQLTGLPDPLPGHVRTVDWLSLRALLPTCAAIVHHGGMGSMYAAFDAGVPQLAIPTDGTDSVANAQVLANRGAGLLLPNAALTPASVARDLGRVLDEPSFRVANGQVAAELHARPTPAAVLAQLVDLLDPTHPNRGGTP